MPVFPISLFSWKVPKSWCYATCLLKKCISYDRQLGFPSWSSSYTQKPSSQMAHQQRQQWHNEKEISDDNKEAFSQTLAGCKFVALKSRNESILKVSVCSWAQMKTGKWFHNKNRCLRLTHNDSTNAGGKPQHICIIFTFLARENRRLNQLWHMTVDDIFNVYLLYYT